MNKRDFLSRLSTVADKYKLDRSEIMIVGSCAAVLNGIETYVNDIDTLIGFANMDRIFYIKNATEVLLPTCGNMEASPMFTLDKVDFVLHGSFDTCYPTFNHRKFKVLTKLGLLQYRLDLGREKDFKDILALMSYWTDLDDKYTARLIELRKQYGK